MTAIFYDPQGHGDKFEVAPIPESHLKEARRYRELLVERLAEWDESLMEKLLREKRFQRWM